jgi:uncharacterized protein YdeI (YjbR/CyaY-like superfamily)
MPPIGATLRPRTRAAWRAWLDRNRAAREIWLLLAKEHVAGRWLTYEEALEEALTCPPSYRKLVLYWIADAKRPETRARRIADLIARSARGERRF